MKLLVDNNIKEIRLVAHLNHLRQDDHHIFDSILNVQLAIAVNFIDSSLDKEITIDLRSFKLSGDYTLPADIEEYINNWLKNHIMQLEMLVEDVITPKQHIIIK